MAIPFLDALNALARTAYPFVKQGVRAGLSSRQIDGAIREGLGSSPRRQTLLDMIRWEKVLESAGAQLRFLKLDAFPNPARLPDALTKIRRRYSFEVEVRGRLLDTGLPWSQYVTVTTDDLMTRSNIQDAAMEAAEAGASRYGLAAETAVLTGGIRSGAAGHF